MRLKILKIEKNDELEIYQNDEIQKKRRCVMGETRVAQDRIVMVCRVREYTSFNRVL